MSTAPRAQQGACMLAQRPLHLGTIVRSNGTSASLLTLRVLWWRHGHVACVPNARGPPVGRGA
eukprot:CAMPEP_0177658062 /NCGR_PEP_ID=MMETSP0447-20121125/16588_1 /TAXON_ID=0 /ORGANISM="Stygamoeba regulata, Strain BSH-02190019" /LENGTH=62 /DNA_ID=CAMNT_0019162599 /DNA_START=585 /DNA_END=769 /DNA_ORIENTATION=-